MTNHNEANGRPDEQPDVVRRPSLASSRTMSDSGRRISQQHVRFSTDIERSIDDRVNDANTNANTNANRIAGDNENTDRRPSSRGLTIDTGLAPPSVRSPVRSPTSPLSPNGNPPASATLSPISPPSPEASNGRSRSRNRGYSLRRSIFNKNIQTTPDQDAPPTSPDISPRASTEITNAPAPNAPSAIEEKDELHVLPTVADEPLSKGEAATYISSDPSDGPLKEYMSVAQGEWNKKKASGAVIMARAEAFLKAMEKFILRIKDIPPTKDGRHIDLNPSLVDSLSDERTGKPYIGNWIRSSRYSFWSFFPRQFFAQFTKLANFYFLVVAILQMIPGLSTTGTYTTLVPLLIFVGISMGKEGFDDWRRYRLDKEENNRHAWVLRPGQLPVTDGASMASGAHDWVEVKWQDIRVGDVIKLERDQPVPADFALLHANGPNGIAYIETMALDGETNLKNKQACQPVAKVCATVDDIISNALHFVVEDPNIDLYKFDGHVTVNAQQKLPLTNNEIVYRGSILRNTDSAFGMVIYTGEECKIRMNANKNPRIKKPALQGKVNRVVMLIVLLVLILAAVCTIAYKFWSDDVEQRSWYLSDASVEYGPIFTSFLIMFNTMIPISLYVSMEIVKVVQMLLLNDIDMYDPETDTPLEARTSTINEELGQVSYIFSDKTGTLTQNVMEFKKCTINGVPYGEAYTEAQAGMQARQGIDTEAEGARAREQIQRDRVRMIERARKMHNNPYLWDDDLTFVAPDFIEDLAGDSGQEQKRANEQFMLALALCHTVVSEKTPGDPPKIEFKAQSPDEAALVATARDVGFTFVGRDDDKLIVNAIGEEKRYTVLNTLEFNSTRKRMSAIIRMPDGKIILFCKGADSMIYSRLIPDEQRELRATTGEHLEMFAREGLRTLCIAQKQLSEEEYQEWNKEYDLAANAVVGREEKLEEVSSRIETDLWLIGGTAIEDKLQDNVPESISLLGKAGIKLWVLTGDKVETVINIGFSCNLLNNDMDLMVLKVTDQSLATAEAWLDEKLAMFGMVGSQEELDAAQTDHVPPPPTHAIVVDGDSLKLALDDSLKRKFLLLCKQCRAVLCCRVSPAQKAAVVNMVKTGLDCLTLAIGDGANDVAMIQEAHIGVGIAGLEGRAAAMSSDYAFGQFRFLTRLVLVHGRWSYRRIAECIANFFYKVITARPSMFVMLILYRTSFGHFHFSGTKSLPITTASTSSITAISCGSTCCSRLCLSFSRVY